MRYIEIVLPVSNSSEAEVVMAWLGDWPFESFSEEESTLHGYITQSDYAIHKEQIEAYLRESFPSYECREIEDQNWNAVWESNFDPIAVEGKCLIRAPFHPADASFDYQIEIMPKMSFGTGHHATTYLMVAEILSSDFSGLKGLDMGTGTGVLAILAVKRGAVQVDAIDIDPWAYENSVENLEANGVADRVCALLGDSSLLEGRSYDFILANINRNILLGDMARYSTSLKAGGTLTVSGILEQDVETITASAQGCGLSLESHRSREGWMALSFRK